MRNLLHNCFLSRSMPNGVVATVRSVGQPLIPEQPLN